MKKINFLILLTLFSLISLMVKAQTFAGGTGIESDPYLIATSAHVQSMHSVDYTNPVYFKLTADVDMTGIAWTPLNNVSGYTKIVHFNGNSHLIKNLSVSGSVDYASFLGVLRGSCKNLGVVDASILSTKVGAGIIAGYAGLKEPSTATFTGLIENCFTSGVVSGLDAVGGIVGNIGKPYQLTYYSGVKNSYSTANVTATNTNATSRAGGIAGINYDNGIIENCHASGTVTSKGTKGAGGIVGWSDNDIIGCVALNPLIKNELSGSLGRIAANMGAVGGVQAQGINCWASENVVVDNAGTIRSELNMVTGTVVTVNTPYDGETKTSAFLSDFSNYETTLDWDFDNIWASGSGFDYPIQKWYKDMLTTNIQNSSENSVSIVTHGHILTISATDNIQHLKIFTLTGNTVYDKSIENSTVDISLSQKSVYLIALDMNGQRITRKIIL